jgi:hypothetical protein
MFGATNLIGAGSPGGSSGSLFASEIDISSLPVGATSLIRKYSKAAKATISVTKPISTFFEKRGIPAEPPC